MPPPSGVKLRDSCDACAVSKVKCSKGKPTCTRCAEKRITCQYLVTQRTGRKLRGRSNAQMQNNGATSNLTTMPSSTSPISRNQDAVSGASSFLDSPFPGLDTSLDDLIASFPVSPPFSRPVTSHQNTIQDQPDISSQYAHESYAASQADALPQPLEEFMPASYYNEVDSDRFMYGLTDPSRTPSLPGTQLSQLGETQSAGAAPQTGCLKDALQLMEQLSCRESALHASLTTPGHGYQASRLSSVQAVIDKNKEVLETIDTMLQLPCSQDGYFLVVISLVVSRVMSGYANAARVSSPALGNHKQSLSASTSISSHRSTPVTTDRIPGTPLKTEEIDPKTAQWVLNELYPVQGLVDKLGSKMQLCTKRNRTFGSEAFPLGNDTALTAFPFSATLLNQLNTELRKRLSTLSLELIDGIRQYWG